MERPEELKKAARCVQKNQSTMALNPVPPPRAVTPLSTHAKAAYLRLCPFLILSFILT